MNMLKRTLAMILVLCMTMSLVPVNAFATEIADAAVETTVPVADVPDSENVSDEGDAEVPSEEDILIDKLVGKPTVGEVTIIEDLPGEGSDVMPLATADAPTTNLSTSGSPFQKGTGESNSFRIPALVTLSDGTLVAAADARWNTTYDGGGLDTMVAISKDNGATWTHSFANYLGDNGNVYSGSSSCFIDPSLAVYTTDENKDGVGEDTIFMLCDLYPYGVALNGNKETTPSYSVGFNDAGYLRLTNDNHSNYNYYLKDGVIYDSSNNEVSGYTVDAHFNIKSSDGSVNTNLFFSDSPYKVVRTGFLYLTKSTDGGKNWSAPQLLKLKTNAEMVCLVGPNGGMVTSEGVIVFPVYSYTGSTEYTGLIYSTDGGTTWQRSANFTEIRSSEADAVELGNGKLRVFFRNQSTNLCYADYDLTTNSWGSLVNTRVYANSNTELSAITYSKGVMHDGVEKDVILVSAPASANLAGSSSSDGSWRTSGRIFAGLVDPETYEMTWLEKSVQVTPVATSQLSGDFTAAKGFFAYSSITEMIDEENAGTVAILYENNQYGWGTGDNYYYTLAYDTFTESELETALGVTFSGNTDVDNPENGESYEKSVTLKVGGTFTETVAGIYVESGSTETTVADVAWVGTIAEGGTTEKLTAATIPTSTGSVECYISDGNGNYLTLSNGALTNATSAAAATKWTVTFFDTPTWADNVNKYSRYRINSGSYYIDMNEGVLGVTTGTTNINHWYTAENGFFGGFAGTNGWQYANGSWAAVNASGFGNAKAYSTDVETVAGEGAKSTAVTITGKAAGTTTVQIGEAITYEITVTSDAPTVTKEVDVTVKVGETSQVYTDTTGNYENNIAKAPDTTIATMDVTGVEGNPETTVSTTKATELEDGATYIIRVYNTNYALTSNKGNTTWADSDGDPRAFEAFYSAEADNMWTLEASGDGYKLKSAAGYLNLGKNAAWITATGGDIFTLTYTNGSWAIGDGTYNIDALGGLTSYYCAGGWPDSATRFDLYKVTTATPASSEITFTGKSVGNTTAIVGTTQYNITVTANKTVVDIELEVGETFTYTDTTGNYVGSDTIVEPNGTYATMEVAGTSNTVQKKLVPVTASTFETSKRYVIENVRAKTNQPTDSVLTSDELTYTLTGLDMNGPLDVTTSPTWIFTPDDNFYLISRNGEYLYVENQKATMETAASQFELNYVDGKGWTMEFNGIYLCDLFSTDSGEAFGTTDANNEGNYWNIYEVVEETLTDATKVTFTGVAEGTTSATVGYTQYNITVVPAELDDEVMNSATGIWTVDPEIQRNRYNSIVNGKHKDLYTDDSWKQYEAARQAAYKKLVEVTNAEYTSQADADAALAELKTLVDALDAAAKLLESAITISVRYRLNTADGTLLDTREYKITSTDTSVTLPDTIVVNNIAYKVSDPTLELQGAETAYDVVVTEIGKLGGGFVGSQDIDLGKDHNNHDTVCDLVDDSGDAKKITEMTLTVGISYDLDLATEMKDGYTVEWTVENTDTVVATVDADGKVTAVAPGTTNVTATVKDASGNIVEVNSMPVTVYPKGSADRYTAIYIEEVDNTTVWCVVNGDTDAYAFEVAEGELIYGQFDTTVSDGTKTTAVSFFGDPDEAHALVYMKSTNSDDHYYLLHDDNGNLYDGTVSPNSNYYVSGNTSGAGWWQAVGLTDNQETNTAQRWEIVKDMVQWAINQGCDGGLGFTRRQNEGPLGSNLSFKSDPMARIEKVVDGVLPTSRKQADYRHYVDNMVAAVHELVYFKITVTLEAPSVWTDANETVSAITYSSAIVTDDILPGAYLYTQELDQADGTWDGEVAEGFREQTDDITDELNAAWTDAEKEAGKRVLDYYLVYEIQESDIPKFWIDNIANLSYNYKSHYSTGAQAGSADAEARISVVGSAIDSVVIDFGQSFTYEGHDFTSITDGKTYTFKGLTNVHLKGAYVDGVNDDNALNADGTPRTTSKATAQYGTVKVTRTATGETDNKGYPEYTYTVTYTPTQILQGVDIVLIYGLGENDQEKVINGFLVYPATTVYYEEGFMMNEKSTWDNNAAKRATGFQEFELLGASQFDTHGMLTGKVSNKKHAYGYDPLYTQSGYTYGDSYASAETIGQTTTFQFTGTGFDLYANCTMETGYVSILVKNSAGKFVKMYTVDTIVKAGETVATQGSSGNEFHLPIVSADLGTHDTYTVTLTKIMETEPVKLDGIRIHNTVKEADPSQYAIDLEDNMKLHQLRDHVLTAVDVNKIASKEYGEGWLTQGSTLIGPLAEQVYGTISADGEAPSAVVTSIENIYGTGATAQDLLDNGPKNELFLFPDQTLTFNVTTSRAMQIGLKAPRTATNYDLSYQVGNAAAVPVATAKALATSVDMFYELGNPTGTATTYTVSVTNTGNDILSVTDLKICDDPNAAFVPLTVADIENILLNSGLQDTDDGKQENPFEDVSESAYYYEPVLWAVEEGITSGYGNGNTFAPDMVCNRGQVVTFLWRAAGEPEPSSTVNPFTDIQESDYYYKAVLWAVEKGITAGYGANDIFNPDGNCTRGQVATFLWRYFGEPAPADSSNPFADVETGAYYYDAVLWAVEQGITNGYGDESTFAPDAECNRGQVVTFLYRAMN